MDKYGEDKKVATACKILDEGFEDAMQVMVLPENIRQRLRTTNVLERLNEEVRRRERVVRIFPNCDSVIRIIGALLMERMTNGLLHLENILNLIVTRFSTLSRQ